MAPRALWWKSVGGEVPSLSARKPALPSSEVFRKPEAAEAERLDPVATTYGRKYECHAWPRCIVIL